MPPEWQILSLLSGNGKFCFDDGKIGKGNASKSSKKTHSILKSQINLAWKGSLGSNPLLKQS